nr:hypothetical protein [Tanacetum cinerariifolium]
IPPHQGERNAPSPSSYPSNHPPLPLLPLPPFA